MAKLSTEIVKRLKKIGLKTEDEKVARKGLLEILKKNGIDGMEDEDTDSLLEMAESFVDEDEEEEEEDDNSKDSEDEEDEEEDDEEDDSKADSNDDEEEDDSEVEKKAEKKKSPKKEIKKESEKSPKKKVKTSKKKEIEEESDELADEVEEEESEKNPKKEVKKEKKVKTPKKSRTSKKGIKLDFKHNEEIRKYLDPFRKLFDPKKYDYNYVSNAGVTIKHVGKNSKRGVVLVENCFLHPDKENEITCNLYLNLMIKKTDLLEEKGIDFKPCWNDTPMVKDITFEEAIEIIKSIWDDMSNIINGIDNRLGENRKKMEKALDKATKPNLRKISKKGKK